jgi:hypothetical protein
MQPLVLSHVVINVTRPRLPVINIQLQQLASQEQRAASFIRELSIRSLSPMRDPQPTGAQMAFSGGIWQAAPKRDATKSDQDGGAVMKDHLEDAIANMVNLQTLRFVVNELACWLLVDLTCQDGTRMQTILHGPHSQ